MISFRFAAALLAGALSVAPAAADEHATYEYLEVAAPGFPACRVGMLATLPSSWRSEHGAAILLATRPAPDAVRDMLVSALTSEHAAVLELVPLPCSGMAGGQDNLIGAALGALDAMKRTLGAGLVVAIGYGPGSAAVLEVVGEPAGRLLGPDGSRYAAAIAMGDGAPALALGAPSPAWEQAPARLAALCGVLAGVAGGVGATSQPGALARAACRTANVDDASRGATLRPAASGPVSRAPQAGPASVQAQSNIRLRRIAQRCVSG